MKKLFALVFVSVLAVNPVSAQEGGHHDGMMQGGTKGHGSGMGMMGGGHMHERMQRMHETMSQVRQTQDPEKRRELMREHMKTMRSTMQQMYGGRMGNMEEGDSSQSGMPMEKRMQRMEQHMQMMQGMMMQMMERESLEE
ncbi:MAG: hypothetical protein GWN58_03460 [Anaerolineae bacterium]|nr:hypothetical protein [Anaerolineae bacterium]